MAVSKATIKSQYLALYARAKSEEMTDDEYADAEAEIVKNAVLSITVTVAGVQSGGSTITGTNT